MLVQSAEYREHSILLPPIYLYVFSPNLPISITAKEILRT